MHRLKIATRRHAAMPPDAELTISPLAAFAVIFSLIWLLHLPLLRLPYFWDEAGYFVPAARDLWLRHRLIATSTLSNAHPPLVMAWLALWWKFSGYTMAVTRTAMLLVAAFTLLGVFRLARQVSSLAVAGAATLATALFPVFFAQSSLVQLDMAAAGFTLWGLAFYLGHRRRLAILSFALAAMAKETAVLAPVALCGWEIWCGFITRRRGADHSPDLCPAHDRATALSFGKNFIRPLGLLVALLPLAAWYGYHYNSTGHVFGNPEFFRYNVQATLHPTRIAVALVERLWHLLLYLNMFVLTGSAALALLYSPLRSGTTKPGRTEGAPRPGARQRRPIAPSAQRVLLIVTGAYVVVMAVIGGAVLARYLLPVYPVVMVLCVHTLWRRVPWWPVAMAVVAVAFVAGWFVQPPYRISIEDNLTYSDFVRLHKIAAGVLAKRNPERVLSAWPASDELTSPSLGYVDRPIPVLAVENSSVPQMMLAAQQRESFSYALLFSTKYEPAHPLLDLVWWRRLQERFFDYHQDVPAPAAASMLGGRIIFQEHRGREWVAIIEIEQIRNAQNGAAHPEPVQAVPVRAFSRMRILDYPTFARPDFSR